MIDIPTLEDDGLITPEIGSWGVEKYKHVALYSSVFIRSMRKIWECLVYIDLFSGAGRSRIRGTNRIIPASPLIALGLAQKFDKYIFCEKDRKKYDALGKRIKRSFDACDVSLINGDANSMVEEMLSLIPQYSGTFRVLSFCFADPYSFGNLFFSTIRKLSKIFMDFLILIPSGMDATRNLRKYLSSESPKLDNFLGRTDWRELWKLEERQSITFERFVIKEFSKSMKGLDFIDPGLDSTVLIHSDEKKLFLYRLVLYSRRELGNTFWKEIKKCLDPQRELTFPNK